jgi:uncharacterized coiled-coil protein SlyX
MARIFLIFHGGRWYWSILGGVSSVFHAQCFAYYLFYGHFPFTPMENKSSVDRLTDSVNLLLARFAEFKSESSQQKRLILDLEHERDQLKSKLAQAQARLSQLIERFPKLTRGEK